MKTNDIITDRLILRSMTLDDVDFLAKLWNEPEVSKYLNVQAYKDSDELRDQLGDMDEWEDEYPFIAYDKITNKPIGTCSAATEGPKGSWGIGYDITKELWGNGYATEMASAMIDFIKSLGVREFYCTVAIENIASCRVMEKCGLKVEETSSFKNHKTGVDHKSYIYKMSLE